ncbi:MAG: hypothetical protein IT440_04115, partial [Phycisphaeraceae bacterium]|nr:hypothetical protein [Phycisphaeraceae bacterium]
MNISKLTPSRLTFLGALTVAAALHALVWSHMPPVRTPQQATPLTHLHGASYSPFRLGHNPVTGVYPTAEEIDQDVALLKDRVDVVRTYGSAGGLEIVPAIARHHGLKVNAGAWLNTDPQT